MDFYEPSGPIVLMPRSALKLNTVVDAVAGFRRFKRVKVTLHVIECLAVVGDKLDVYVNVDGVGAVHFPQISGNGAEATHVAFLEPGLPAATTFDVTADPAAGVVRPYVWGDSYQVNCVVTDGGAHGQHFVAEVTAEGQA